jgi:phage-related minor tail protein
MKDKVSDSVSSLKDNTIGKFREMWDELVGHSIVPDMADQIVATYQAMTARVSEIIDIGAMNVENRMRQMAMRVASESQNAFIGLGKGEELTGGSFYAPKERTGAWFGDLDIKPVENLNSTLDETADKTSKLNMESALWADNLSKGLADAIVKGKDLGDVFDNILKQLASSVLQKLIMGFLPFADGGVIDKGKVQPYANGGIVNKPTIFPMASGAGLMGEAGPEAILPLKRNSQGDLGVASEGGGATHITMNVNAVDANSFVKMLQNNKTAITSLVVENISGNGQIRRAIQGAR